MPRGDGTGPMGQSSLTGRRAGLCAGNTLPGFANRPQGIGGCGGQGAGRGCGPTMGGGRGWRNMFRLTGLPGWMRSGQGGAPSAAVVDERLMLEQQAETLKVQLDQINRKLSKLGA